MNDIATSYDWIIASTVFYVIHTFLLAVVVIYTLNAMLRKQLGHNPSALRKVFGPVLFVLGGLLLSYVSIQSYVGWTLGRMYRAYEEYYNIAIDGMSPTYVWLAFEGTFLVSILGSGAFSIITAHSLRKRHGTSNVSTPSISDISYA